MPRTTLALAHLVLTLLLFGSPLSYAQSGGDTVDVDAEEDNKPVGCFAREPEQNTANELVTANSIAALLRAQCYSICLEQAELGTGKLSQMQEPHVTMTEYSGNCSLYNQVEECVRGCVIMDHVSSSSLCQQECVTDCTSVNNTDCTYHCDQNQYCASGCLASKASNNSLQGPPMQPFIRPTLQLVTTTPYNVTYSVNISETDLFRVHNITGSGDITKDGASSPVTFIFQIKTNDTYRYIVQPGLPNKITFHDSICEEVEVRYALVNCHGISGYSPPYSLYLQGEIASPPEPVDLPTIAIQSVYDYRRGYFGHARLTITWENPPNSTYISHYSLEMVGAANCGLANYTRIEPSAEVSTTQVVLAALPKNAPYLGCLYQMKIHSASVSDDYPPASTVWHRSVKQTLYNPDITFQCERRLENGSFAIYTTVNMSQYLAKEHVIVKIVLFPTRVEYTNPSKTSVIKRDHLLLQDVSVEANQSVIVTVVPNIIPLSTANVNYEVSMHTTWRDHLVYTPHVFTASCSVDGQGSKPAPVTNVQLMDQFQILGGLAMYIVSLHWTPPTVTNGQLGHYNVCMGTSPLGPTDPLPGQCSATGDCYACTAADPTAFNMTWNVLQLFPPDAKTLYLQVRSNNIYRSGNWSSDPVVIPLLVTSTPTPSVTSLLSSTQPSTTTLSSAFMHVPTETVSTSFMSAESVSTTFMSAKSVSTISVSPTTALGEQGRAIIVPVSIVGGVLIVCAVILVVLVILAILFIKNRQATNKLNHINSVPMTEKNGNSIDNDKKSPSAAS